MPWFRVDDGFAHHPKVLSIPRRQRAAAIGLWTLAGSWSAANLTEGRVPAAMVEELGCTPTAARALVEAGLWRVDVDLTRGSREVYVFHEWSSRNPSRAQVLDERAAAAERQRAARERRLSSKNSSASRRDEPVSHDVSHDVSHGPVTRPRPDPTRPDPEVLPVETQEGVVTEVTRGPRDGPPEPRCPRHRDQPAEGPCGPCGDARRARDAYDRDRAQRQRDSGLVVGGHECPDHPGQPAGQCGVCAAKAVEMPDEVRQLRRRRQLPPRAS